MADLVAVEIVEGDWRWADANEQIAEDLLFHLDSPVFDAIPASHMGWVKIDMWALPWNECTAGSGGGGGGTGAAVVIY